MALFHGWHEFVNADNRARRPGLTLNEATLQQRHVLLLPPDLIRGKSVLDLGCCVGASGAWSMEHGAARYVGVEAQASYAASAKCLLARYAEAAVCHESLEDYVARATDRFDVVLLAGVLHIFLDPAQTLRNIARLAAKTMVVDTFMPNLIDAGILPSQAAIVQIANSEIMNLAGVDGNAVGLGNRVSPGRST